MNFFQHMQTMQTPVFSLEDVSSILYSGNTIDMASLPLDDVEACYEFLKKFAADKVIYGINTGFGPMAQWRVDDKHLKDLQYNIIRSHATGAGAPLDDTCVKAAMIARAGTLLQARSGVHPDAVRLLVGVHNLPAQRAYATLGFEVCGEAEAWGNRWLCYQKRL